MEVAQDLFRRAREAIAALNALPDMLASNDLDAAVTAGFAAGGAVQAIQRQLDELKTKGTPRAGAAASPAEPTSPPPPKGAPAAPTEPPAARAASQPKETPPMPCSDCDGGKTPPPAPRVCETCGGVGACRYVFNGTEWVWTRYGDAEIARAKKLAEEAAQKVREAARPGSSGAGESDPFLMLKKLRELAEANARPGMSGDQLHEAMWKVLGMRPPGAAGIPEPLAPGTAPPEKEHPAWKLVPIFAQQFAGDPILWMMMEARGMPPSQLGLDPANDPRRAGMPR